ncbi:MAG: hypothetical protein HY757_04525 [Nitrospirae bacterium]|nr:hypothetical protein [Nitrospirota bacterium]
MIIRHPVIIFINISAVFLLTITSAIAYEIEFPPKGGLNVKLFGKVTESYNNNITFASEGEDKIEGLLTTTELGLGIQYSGKRRVIGLDGRANWQIPTKVLDVENSSENLTFTYQEGLSEFDGITLSDTYSHSQVPESFDEEFGRSGGRFDSYNNTFNINYRREISKDLSTDAIYSYGLNWFSREKSENSRQHNLNLGVNYSYSAATKFLMSYSLANSLYNDRSNISINSITASVQQYITKSLSISGRFGVDRSSQGDNRTTREDYGVSLANVIDIDQKTTVNISILKGIEIKSEEGDIFDSWRFEGSLHRDFMEDLRGSLSGFYGEGTFDLTGITDRLLGASAQLNYTFWENKKGANIGVGLGYTFSKLDSTDKTRAYDRGSLNLGVTAGF